jgi:H+-translocating NAD(P) transhydrogenase subunit beta
VTGALVGSSGAILSYIMCKGMNRSIFNVILGGFGTDGGRRGGRTTTAAGQGRLGRRRGLHDEERQKVIIVPGYGMAVAQAQHALREMADLLKKEGVEVSLRHPPGRGPHARPHERAAGRGQRALRRGFRARRDQPRLRRTDVAFVIGANDVTNPAAKTDNPTSRSTACRSSTSTRPRPCSSSSAAWQRAMPASRTSCSSATTR